MKESANSIQFFFLLNLEPALNLSFYQNFPSGNLFESVVAFKKPVIQEKQTPRATTTVHKQKLESNKHQGQSLWCINKQQKQTLRATTTVHKQARKPKKKNNNRGQPLQCINRQENKTKQKNEHRRQPLRCINKQQKSNIEGNHYGA